MRKSKIMKRVAAGSATLRVACASLELPPGAANSGSPGRAPLTGVSPGHRAARQAERVTARAAVSSGRMAAGNPQRVGTLAR